MTALREGAQPSLFPELETPRPLAGCVTPSWHAWAAMQRAAAAALKRARSHHRKTADILRRRSEIVHAALRGAA